VESDGDPVRLHAATPFRTDMNLGRAYNEFMELIPDNDWAVLMDHDAMFTTSRWHAQILEAVEHVGRYAPVIFSAMTNRCAAPYQRPASFPEDVGPQLAPSNDDIVAHRKFGARLVARRTLLDCTETMGVAGVVLVISKQTWHDTGKFVDGLFCVDHQMHYANRDLGGKTYLIEGLYVYHHRSSSRDPGMLATAPKAKRRGTIEQPCECRGPNPSPTRRETLA
jgi:hypothetical protein